MVGFLVYEHYETKVPKLCSLGDMCSQYKFISEQVRVKIQVNT